MAYYQSQFSTATVTPKLHILEEHVVPWIKKWGMGFGLSGEQGAESIHAYFNKLRSTYNSIPERLSRLKQMMFAQHLKHSFIHLSAQCVNYFVHSSLPLRLHSGILDIPMQYTFCI